MTAASLLVYVSYALLVPKSPPPDVVKGVVEDEKGRPVSGAVVVVSPSNLRSGEDPKSAISGADGAFELSLEGARGPFSAEAYAPGHAPWLARELDTSGPVRVVLSRSAESIVGVVRDGTTFEPISGAIVETRAVRGDAGSLSKDPRLGVVEAMTDGRGEFRLEGLAARAYPLSASAPGYGRASKPSVPTGERVVEIFLFPGVGIYGRITGEDGEPVEGALVSSEWTARDFTREVGASVQKSDTEGRFAFLGLEPGRYRLFVLDARFAPQAFEAEVGKESDAEIEIVLRRGATVTGRLEDEIGDLVVGRISVRSLDCGSVSPLVRGRLTTETEADGDFSLGSLSPGEHALLVEATGYAPETVEVSVGERSREEDLGTVVLAPGRTIQGRVVDEAGGPVGDVRVFGFKTSGGMMSFAENELSETFTDADGRFVLAGLSEGVYRLRAQASGFAAAGRVSAEPGRSVTLTLRAAGSIRGVVVDPENRPVTTYLALARSASSRRSVGSDRGDHEAGVFLIESLAEGEYALEIQASDFVPEALSGVRVTRGRVSDVGTIRLDRGGRIAGSVLDSAGAPVAGATVEIETPGQRFFRTFGNGVNSDRQGRFEIRGVPEGVVGLVARHPSYAAARLDRIAVDPRSGPTEVEIVLRRGGAVEGYVRTRDGTDIAARTVEAVPASSDFSIRDSVTAQTSEDGSFRFDHLPPGPADVALLSTGTPIVYAVQSKPVTVVEGETAYVELVSRKILVHGQVKKGGIPLGGVELELWPTKGGRRMSVTYGGAASLRPKPVGPQYLAAITNGEGFYELLVDDPAEYRLETSVGGVGLPSKTVVVPDVDVFPLDLDYGGAAVSGRAVDRETEAPIAGAWVSARPTDSSLRDFGAHLQAGSSGSFSLEVDPGEYTLVVRSEGYATAERKIRVGEAGVSDLVIALSPGLEIRGRVVDATGRGLGNVRVFAADDAPDPSAVATTSFGMTLPDGRFVFGELSRGTYNLLANAGSLGGFAFAPGVAAGTQDVTLTLRPPGRIDVEVVDETGAPVPAAFASVAAIDGRSARGVSGQTDAEGRLVLTAPTGNLTIKAVLGNSPEALGSVALGATAAGRIRLEIPR